MGADDILIVIVSLILLALFILKPLLTRTIIKTDRDEGPPAEDPSYGSVESYARRILPPMNRDFTIKQPRIPEQEHPRERQSVLGRMEQLSELKKAVLWKEILSPPPSLDDRDDF